ncbi:MAG: NAD(P)H-hydrate dehydratase [Coriobacteriia bacterium]|nr:NAD(P)H-hydrate dehydratase [Coriobacteriia bacterium]
MLPEIHADANKYTRGSLLVIAGSTRYPGAAILAAQAAARSGTGYVTLAVPAEVVEVCQSHLLTIPVLAAKSDNGCFAADALPVLLNQIRQVDAVLIGPGMTATEATCRFLTDIFRQVKQPMVLDADALNLLSWDYTEQPALPISAVGPSCFDDTPPTHHLLWELLPNDSILTPHDGELHRLLDATSTTDAAELATHLSAVVVSKGPTTTVYSHSATTEPYLFAEGTPALAKAGTGDVLAGITASLLAQGATAWQAAKAAVEIHGKAGRIAEAATSRRAMIARDVIDAIAPALRELEGC